MAEKMKVLEKIAKVSKRQERERERKEREKEKRERERDLLHSQMEKK